MRSPLTSSSLVARTGCCIGLVANLPVTVMLFLTRMKLVFVLLGEHIFCTIYIIVHHLVMRDEEVVVAAAAAVEVLTITLLVENLFCVLKTFQLKINRLSDNFTPAHIGCDFLYYLIFNLLTLAGFGNKTFCWEGFAEPRRIMWYFFIL